MTLAWLVCCVVTLAAEAPAPAVTPPPDPWAPVRFLEGEWVGTAQGEPGVGTVHRSYAFVLGHRFLHERNVSAYAPKKPATGGELHEHWSMLSHDRRRGRLVLRQFHQESFVIQYAMVPEESTATRLVFATEAIENLDSRWRARETYEVQSLDRFVETFELAAPGKDFTVYSKNTFTRVGAP
jgi:hypothetical protein